ncbi:suppressor of loss of ypt1 [Steccherinum ochraceum]|uniref:Suppressor of loss of ypt1 n=1 Tax=Steccherinum ochraceum TaxID=92696 RepID=A0A4R0RSH3_9APHY|nr:suppressor of loss of ypt1 [Steccherinum ochraceum]
MSWSHPPNNNQGRGAYDARDGGGHRAASWLADPRQRSLPTPRFYDDDKPQFSAWLHRFQLYRKALLRKLPSMDSLFQSGSSRVSLTAQTPTSASTAAPSPDTVRFVLLCGLWYMSSALSSNTGKSIMNEFRYPVTLTFVQFGFVAGWCLFFLSPMVRFSSLRRPTKEILKSTFPMGCFQVGGHIFSSMAISRIPVSTVHTIKALSPLFTVAAYALFFGVKYSPKTYFSLLPLTVGVMLACSFATSASSFMGLICAFGSAIIFVSQNIFFKKIVPSNGQSTHKLDKLNLLLYSSGMAFLLMIPIWVYTDLPVFLASSSRVQHPAHGSESSTPSASILYNFFLNGTVHFGQNVLAFVLLAKTSPVTYSIASLVKRVAVICCAIVWFNQRVHGIQAFGIAMTFVGLWFYQSAKGDVDKGEKKVGRVVGAREGMLPRTMEDLSDIEQAKIEVQVQQSSGVPVASAYSRPRTNSTHMHHHHSHAAVPAPPMPMAPRQPQTHHTPSHSQTLYSQTHPHAHPNLYVHIAPPPQHAQPTLETVKEKVNQSPVDSYPSPPPSIDSPPESPSKQQLQWDVPLVTSSPAQVSASQQKGRARRGTITGGFRAHAQGVAVAS